MYSLQSRENLRSSSAEGHPVPGSHEQPNVPSPQQGQREENITKEEHKATVCGNIYCQIILFCY